MIGKDDQKYSMKQIGNRYVSDIITIANSFNNYFTNIGGSLAKTIKSDIDPLVFLHTNINSIIFLKSSISFLT